MKRVVDAAGGDRGDQMSTPRRALKARFSGSVGSNRLVDVRGALSAGSERFAVHSREGLRRTIVGAQPEDQAPPMLNQSPGTVDEFLHHRLQPPALGLVSHR